ncbi:MAG: hypothetical protein ACR2HQ_10685 [Ilumatobacteraceae bacterium]
MGPVGVLNSKPEMEGHVLALYGATVSLVTPIGGLTLAMITELSSVWISVAVSGALLLLVAVAFRVLRPAALVATDPQRHHGAVLHHASHFGQFVGGFVHPGQFSVSLPQGSSGTTADGDKRLDGRRSVDVERLGPDRQESFRSCAHPP